MTEYQELKTLIENTDKKVDRILSWAEGDEKLGTPSVMQRINENTTEIKNTRKMVYEIDDKVAVNARDIKNLNKRSGAIGAGTGGVVAGIVELLKSLF